MNDERSNFVDKFDATLHNAMKDHHEEVPEGFVDNIIQRLRSQQFADSTSQTDENFDMAIKIALVEHTEPVPAGFADTVVRRMRTQQEQKLIAEMARQERFILAGCIGLFAIAVGLIFVFSGPVLEAVSISLSSMSATGSNMIIAVKGQWQIIVCTMVAMATVIYSFTSSGLFRFSRA